jgi:hypothetical protein
MSETELILIADCTGFTEYVVLIKESIISGYFYLCFQISVPYTQNTTALAIQKIVCHKFLVLHK